MSNPALGIAETIQTASIKKHPSPAYDINPATAASEKQPVTEATPSEAGSYPSDVVDPRHTIRPVPRRSQLPPLPDLRFEQSYLASIKGAETWQRVTWITIRDQVCSLSNTRHILVHACRKVHRQDTSSFWIWLGCFGYRSFSLFFKAHYGLLHWPGGGIGTAMRR